MVSKSENPIKRSEHGSKTQDEFCARMRDAGYEDWEIEEELADQFETQERNQADTERLYKENTESRGVRILNPIDEHDRELIDRAMKEFESLTRLYQSIDGIEHALFYQVGKTVVMTFGNNPENLDIESIKSVVESLPSNNRGTLAINVKDGKLKDAYVIHEELPPFERIRRITGYLVGSLDRFNDAKLSEVNERKKHLSVREEGNACKGAAEQLAREHTQDSPVHVSKRDRL